MADVILGPVGSTVVVDFDICVKTGQVTSQRAIIRGQTTPAWVSVLLIFTIIGFLFANAMTSRRFRVDLPFSHVVHGRWRRNRRVAWLVGLAGACALIAAATSKSDHAGVWVGVGAALVAVALVAGAVNAIKNNVGIHATRDSELVLTRAHPEFAVAVSAALREPLAR